jgi:transposase
MDLRRESDIEQLRRVAVAQQMQIEQPLRVLRAQAKERAHSRATKHSFSRHYRWSKTSPSRRRSSRRRSTRCLSKPVDGSHDRKPRDSSGPTEQPSLPIVEQTFELDDADKMCPSCGGTLSPMKGQFETSEMIDVVEVSYRVVRVQQQKYACKCGGCIETAPGPERATPGGRYSLDFAIKVAIDKYLDHIPLARQERILRRHGLLVTTQTLWDQLLVLGKRLESASRALLARLLAEPVIGLDQTSWPRLDGKGDKPWQMWCLTAAGVVVHRIREDKSKDTFKAPNRTAVPVSLD